MSGAKESHVPSHRHQRVPDSWQRDSDKDRVNSLSKDYPNEFDTTAKDAGTSEGNKDKDLKAVGNKWEGLRSETSEEPAAQWCGTHK